MILSLGRSDFVEFDENTKELINLDRSILRHVNQTLPTRQKIIFALAYGECKNWNEVADELQKLYGKPISDVDSIRRAADRGLQKFFSTIDKIEGIENLRPTR